MPPLGGCAPDDDDDNDTADDDDTVIDFDCGDLPEPPAAYQWTELPPTEDFTFDGDGSMVHCSVIDGSFRVTQYDGSFEIIIPSISTWPRGTRFLLDGSVVVANPDISALQRVTLDGDKTNLTSTINNPNGVAIRDDGMIYLTSGVGEVWRVDPESGAGEVVAQLATSFDGITFSPSYDTLYVNSEMGQIYAMGVTPEGEVGSLELLTELDLGWEDLLDGMTVDMCGNLYVVQMGGYIWRVTPDGEAEVFIDLVALTGEFCGLAAVNFGSDAGGWERDHLYVTDLIGGVYEFDVGIPGRVEPHLR